MLTNQGQKGEGKNQINYLIQFTTNLSEQSLLQPDDNGNGNWSQFISKALGKEREIIKIGPILHIKNNVRKCDNTDQWTSKALEIDG